MNRRELLRMAGLLGAGSILTFPPPAHAASESRAGIFDVKTRGARGDGKQLDSQFINRTISECSQAGGGIVYVSPGTYLVGTVVLQSNVTLYLEAGATLLGSKKLSDYSPEAGPNLLGDANQKHLLFARDAENVTLAGPGRIDGQGPAFWVPSGRVPPKPQDAWRDVATYDWKPLDRASPLLEFYRCKHLRIEDVRIENASGWTLRPIECDDVFIQGITIKNPVIGPNTDGIDLTCSRNVFISNCLIDTGDDAICLKSESPYGGEPGVSKNITITNCVLTSCCNGFKFGTATRGRFENVTFSNSVIFNDDVPLNARVISGIALEMVDGGCLEGITISNIRMQRARTPIFIRRGVRHAGGDGARGVLRGVMIYNIHATGSILTSSITGLEGFEVEDVTLSNIRINTEENGKSEWVARKIPENEKAYPEARMFGRLPAYGLYCRHVKGLRVRHVEVQAGKDEERPLLVCDDVQDLEVAGLRGTPIQGTQPTVKLRQTRQALLRACVAPAGTRTFLQLQGDRTEGVVLMSNELSAAEKPAESGSDVPEKALKQIGNS